MSRAAMSKSRADKKGAHPAAQIPVSNYDEASCRFKEAEWYVCTFIYNLHSFLHVVKNLSVCSDTIHSFTIFNYLKYL